MAERAETAEPEESRKRGRDRTWGLGSIHSAQGPLQGRFHTAGFSSAAAELHFPSVPTKMCPLQVS